MPLDFSFTGQSQRFQVIVVLLTGMAVLTAIVGVSALAGSGTGIAIQPSGGDGDFNPVNPLGNGENSDGTNSGDGSTSDSDTDGSGPEIDINGTINDGTTPGPSETNGENPTGGASAANGELKQVSEGAEQPGVPGILNAGQATRLVESASGIPAGERQTTPGSLDALLSQVHFGANGTTGSNEGYWRATAYETYDSDGAWTQETLNTGERVPTESDTPGSESYSMTLYENASVIPVSGAVESLQISSGADPAEFTFRKRGDGTVVVTDTEGSVAVLPEGTTLDVAVSPQPPQANVEPQSQGNIYTETESGVDRSVEERADQVVRNAGAETNREQAEAITQWVRANNEYRVDANNTQGSDPVSTFLSETQAGTSTDFATATAVMLRERGVPARTVTGYRTPSEAGGDGVQGGSMNQHMWVEAMSENGTWMQYDPTPVDRKNQINSRVRAGDGSVTDSGVDQDVVDGWGSGNETLTGEGQNTFDTISADELLRDDGSPVYVVNLDPSPKPGQDVTVSVYTQEMEPVNGVDVYFNDEFVGTTGVEGTVGTTVPYAESLQVTVGEGEIGSTTTGDREGGDASTGTVFDTATQQAPENDENATDETEDETGSSVVIDDGRKIYDLPSDITFESSAPLLPGDTTTATATLDGDPVPGADVTVNGEFVGNTDATGELEITIPNTVAANETVTVGINRGELHDTAEIRVATIETTVDPELIGVPGSDATVQVYKVSNDDREQITDRAINVTLTSPGDGGGTAEEISLGSNGDGTISFPNANQVTVTVAVGDVTDSTTVSGLYYNFAAVAGMLLVIVGIAVAAVTKRYDIGSRIRAGFYWVVFSVSERVLIFGTVIYKSGARIIHFAKQTGHRLKQWVRKPGAASHLASIFTSPSQLVMLAAQYISRVRSWIVELLQSVRGTSTGTAATADLQKSTGDNTSSKQSSPAAMIRKYWKRLIHAAFTRRTIQTKTSVEIESRIVAAGFPERYVRRIRRAFQSVQYGSRSGDEQIASVEDAMESINGTDDETSGQHASD